MFEVMDLKAGYRHLEVLHGVSLHVGDGEVVALLGSNGAGKSTLLKTCAGLLRPRAGQVVFKGVTVSNLAPQKLPGLGIALAMGGHRVFHRQTVQSNLELGSYSVPRSKRRTRNDFDRVFQLFPVLRTKAHHPASTLSGGERQMLAIAQALMCQPTVLMLDEPSSGLAPRLVSDVFDALRELKREGMSLLLAEQTVEQALGLADRGYVLDAGSVVTEGSSEQLRNDQAVRDAYIGSLGKETEDGTVSDSSDA
jgi:branched-chain amino acid transport system ATP-binding protein